MIGNIGLIVRHGLRLNLETGVGLLWITSDYALRTKNRFPTLAPRLNAAGVIMGTLLLSASGIHGHQIDWPRIRTPLGYIPAACIVGLQHEIRSIGFRFDNSASRIVRLSAEVAKKPYTFAAVWNAFGVMELIASAISRRDAGLLGIGVLYGVATLFLPFFDLGQTV